MIPAAGGGLSPSSSGCASSPAPGGRSLARLTGVGLGLSLMLLALVAILMAAIAGVHLPWL